MNDVVAKDIILRYALSHEKLNIICDNTYSEVSKCIKNSLHTSIVAIYNISQLIDIEIMFINVKKEEYFTLLLIEPQSFTNYKVFRWLNFDSGEPVIDGISSKVLVFPIDSALRIFSGTFENDSYIKSNLLNEMHSNCNYRITTENGTRLTFTSRDWIICDFEICTAPIENTINGIIVVDGALFFKKICGILHFYIKDGKIDKIESPGDNCIDLLNEYEHMTRNDFENEYNKQLAEIGLGCSTNAMISDCFMEAEAVYNTCHFCFGNNECYGGKNKSEFHGASVLIKNPRFEIVS